MPSLMYARVWCECVWCPQMQCKLFVFDKPAQSWVERGRGLLRLNDMASTDDGTLQSRLGKSAAEPVPSLHRDLITSSSSTNLLLSFCSDAYTGQPAVDSQHKALASDAGGQSQREKRSDHSHGHRGPGRESLPHIGNTFTRTFSTASITSVWLET